MKLVTFVGGERASASVGCVGDDDVTVHDLSGVVGQRTLLDVVDEWEHLEPAIAAASDLPVVTAPRLLAPITRPRRNLFAVGKNYREHVQLVDPATTALTGPKTSRSHRSSSQRPPQR
ncbi:hypothetical protein [Streptomyces sp. MS1.AVA.4]|uniref:Uncharacterized protein n=1 Tax=Streptomyces pratisoli TaxID=3139917 RepID=A0ACC6Q9M1_9ACTN